MQETWHGWQDKSIIIGLNLVEHLLYRPLLVPPEPVMPMWSNVKLKVTEKIIFLKKPKKKRFKGR